MILMLVDFTAPRPGRERARRLKGVGYALLKSRRTSPTGGTARQLAWVATTDTRLYRAYLLKEGPRHVFSVKVEEGKQALDRWISWARRCRIPVFVDLAARSKRHRLAIDAALDHGLSQGLDAATALSPVNETQLNETLGCGEGLVSDLLGVKSGVVDGFGHQVAQRALPVEFQDHWEGGRRHGDADGQAGLHAQLRVGGLVDTLRAVQGLIETGAVQGGEHLIEQVGGIGEAGQAVSLFERTLDLRTRRPGRTGRHVVDPDVPTGVLSAVQDDRSGGDGIDALLTVIVQPPVQRRREALAGVFGLASQL